MLGKVENLRKTKISGVICHALYGDNEPALAINVREDLLWSHKICNSLKIRGILKRDGVKTITLFRLGMVKGVPSKAEHS